MRQGIINLKVDSDAKRTLQEVVQLLEHCIHTPASYEEQLFLQRYIALVRKTHGLGLRLPRGQPEEKAITATERKRLK